MDVKADTLRYIEGTGRIEAAGSVEVRFKEVTIYADLLRMDSESNLATAEGNVVMVTRDYRALSERVVYDASREVSSFSGFTSRISPSNVQGELYLSAGKIRDLRGKMLGESGSLTSCDYGPPHYFVTADRVEYYPEDKIVGYNVVMFAGEMPVFWTPYLVYDLSRKQRRNWAFGHNEVEGDYIKSAWGYPYGVLYLDLMDKKGFGHGTEVPYALLGLGAGTFFIYHIDEKDTGITDWVTRVRHTKQIDPATTLKLDHEFMATYLIPSGRADRTSFGLDLAHQQDSRWNLRLNTFDDRIGLLKKNSLHWDRSDKWSATQYDFNYDFSRRSPRWLRASQRFYHRQPLWSDRVTLTTRANYYNNVADEGQPGDERLEPLIEILGKEPGYSWRYTENWYIDVDGKTFTDDDNYQYLEKQPEIEVSPDPLDLRLFTLRPKFGYGHYHEVRYVSALGGNRDYSSQRYWGTLDASRSIPVGLGTVVLLGAGIDQYLYTPGDQMYAYRESMSARTNLFGFFKNNLDYKKGSTDGNSPFLFDQLGSHHHNVKDTMTFYYQNKVNWTIDGGHNWQTHEWFDVNTRLRVTPDRWWQWDARTGWDIEERMYKDLVNSLTFAPYSYLSLRFSSVSDMNLGRVKSGSILYDLYFLEGQANQWHLKFNQVYEPASEQFKIRDIMVVKDLHCWVLKYTYSDYRKEFSFTFSLKALPDQPLGMAPGRGFYMEGFEKELKELKPEGAIKRY